MSADNGSSSEGGGDRSVSDEVEKELAEEMFCRDKRSMEPPSSQTNIETTSSIAGPGCTQKLRMPLEILEKVNESENRSQLCAVSYVLGGGNPSSYTSQSPISNPEIGLPSPIPAPTTTPAQAPASDPSSQRNTGPSPQVNVGPGAYPVVGIDGVADNLPNSSNIAEPSLVFGVSQELEEAPNNTGVVMSGTNTINDDHGLVHANQVEEDIDLEEAQLVTPDELVSRKETQQEKTQRAKKITMIAIGVFCVIVASILGITVGVRQTQSNQEMIPKPDLQFIETSTISPSIISPTGAPSPGPDTLKAILPEYSLVHLLDPFSPQYQAYNWVKNRKDFTTLPDWRMTQLFALACFYFENAGTTWPQGLDKNWLDEDRSECDWYSSLYGKFYSHIDGMPYAEYEPGEYQVCNEEGHFVGLSMVGGDPYRQPFGHLPKELSLLTSLKYLKLHTHFEKDANVTFPDMFPPPLPNLQYMDMFLFQYQYENQIGKGTIPSQVGLYTSLNTLKLPLNAATGTIPSEISQLKNLVELRLDRNLLTGSIPELGTLPNLTKLILHQNLITGTIPSSLPPSITVLGLWGNQFTGRIPSELGLTNLTRLELNDNQFTGGLPSQLGLLTSLTHLRLNGNHFTGKLPTEIMFLTNLEKLWLYGNDFLEVSNMTRANLAAHLTKLTDLRIQSDKNEITYYATCNSRTRNASQYHVQNRQYGYLLNAQPGDSQIIGTSAVHTTPDYVDKWHLIERIGIQIIEYDGKANGEVFLVNAEHDNALSYRRYDNVGTSCNLHDFEGIELVSMVRLDNNGSFEACLFSPFWETYLNGDTEGSLDQEKGDCDGGKVWQFIPVP